MTVEQTIKFITDTGATIVLAGVFLYIIIRIANIWISKLENKNSDKKHDAALDLRSSINLEIHELLSEYLEQYHAKRVQVIEFSNTTSSVAHLPFKYMSCTYEVYSYGRDPIGHRIDKISTSLFTPFFEYLQNHDYYIFDVNDKDDNIGLSIHNLLRYDAETAPQYDLSILLKTTKGKAIGFLSVKDDEIDEKDIAGAEKLANHVTALLSVMDDTNNMVKS